MCLNPIEGSEAGAWRRLRKRIPLRNTADALVLYGLLSVFSRTPRDHLSRGGTMHRRLGAPTLIINKKKTYPTVQAGGDSSSTELSLPDDSRLCQGDNS